MHVWRRDAVRWIVNMVPKRVTCCVDRDEEEALVLGTSRGFISISHGPS